MPQQYSKQMETMIERLLLKERQNTVKEVEQSFEKKITKFVEKYEEELSNLKQIIMDQDEKINKLESQFTNFEQKLNSVKLIEITEIENKNMQKTVIAEIEEHIRVKIKPDLKDKNQDSENLKDRQKVILKYTRFKTKQETLSKNMQTQGSGVMVFDD